MTLKFWEFYRRLLVIFAVGIFFTNISDYSQNFGLIPLVWIAAFAVLSGPAILHGGLSGRIPIIPVVLWAVGYLLISLLWFYGSPQDDFAFQEVQQRVLSIIFLILAMIVLSRPEDQLFARKWIAGAVLLACALNVYELFNPLTFSSIPGRSSGLYTNVNQSGAALVLGLILSYHVIPDRLKLLFVGVTAIGIIPTFSRSAMIGWVIVVAYFFVRAGFIAQIRHLTIFTVLGIGLTFSPAWSDVQRTLEERGVLNLNIVERIAFFTSGTTSDASTNQRRAVASRAWDLFGTQPVGGWGTGASRRIDGFDVGTHNIYLAMIVDHGAIGFFIVPLLLLLVLWGVNRKSIDQALPWCMFMMVWGMFSHNVLEERYILLAIALIAAMVASNRTQPITEADITAELPYALPGALAPLT